MNRSPLSGPFSDDVSSSARSGALDRDGSDINPYQPPAQLDEAAAVAAAARAGELPDFGFDGPAIKFSGSPDSAALRSHLKNLDGMGIFALGVLLLVATAGLAGGLLLVLFAVTSIGMGVAGVSLALISMAFGAFALLGAITSSPAYRMRWHQNRFPGWDESISGEMTSKGVIYQRGGQRIAARWEWFAGVVIGKRSICFVPAITELPPVLIGQHMIDSESDWSRLQGLKRERIRQSFDIRFATRADVIKALFQEPLRGLSDDAEAAIAQAIGTVTVVNGPVRSSDLKLKRRSTKAFVRSQISRYTLHAGAVAFVAGIFGLVFQSALAIVAGAFLIVAATAIASGKLSTLTGKRSDSNDLRRETTDDTRQSPVKYFAKGYVTNQHVCVDFSTASVRIGWEDLDILKKEENRIVFASELRSRLALTSSLFDTQEEWLRVRELA